jgi:hypothetical protein
METKTLKEKEIASIKAAAGVVRKFAKYIESVNNLNASLERNLSESIKAGDVTNTQKAAISCHESAEREYKRVYAEIAKKFPCPGGCDCTECNHDNCPAYNMRVVANMMGGVAKGSFFDWNFILEWAAMGRWEWAKRHGYRTAPDDPQKAFGLIAERAKNRGTSEGD